MAKRGRKKLDEVDKRKHGITCRLTDDELVMCDAARGVLTRGEWMRIASLKKLPPIIPQLNQHAWIELSHSAANLNQLAHKLNSGEAADAIEIRQVLTGFRFALLGVPYERNE